MEELIKGLSSLNENIEEQKKKCEAIMPQIIQEIEKFSVDFIEKNAKEIITKEADITKKIGIEGVRKIKEELKAYEEEISQLIETTFNHWAHRYEHIYSYDEIVNFACFDNLCPYYFNSRLEKILEKLNTIVSNYGYKKIQISGRGGTPNISCIPISKTLKEEFTSYYNSLKELQNLLAGKENALKKIKAAEAEKIWEEA